VMVTHPWREWAREAVRALWPHLAVLAVMASLYIPMVAAHQNSADPDETYRMEFTPRVFLDGLYYYVSRMMYGRPWPVGRLIRWSVMAAAMAAGVAWRVRATLIGIAGFVIFLGPVIFLARQRDPLYLYIPAAFFVMALGGAAEAAAERMHLNDWAAAAMMLLCVVALPHVAYMQRSADWMIENTIRARQDLEAFRAHCKSLKPGARVALIGFPDGYNLFRTPGCSVLKVTYRVDPVSCVFTEDASGADVVVVYRGESIEVRPGGG